MTTITKEDILVALDTIEEEGLLHVKFAVFCDFSLGNYRIAYPDPSPSSRCPIARVLTDLISSSVDKDISIDSSDPLILDLYILRGMGSRGAAFLLERLGHRYIQE